MHWWRATGENGNNLLGSIIYYDKDRVVFFIKAHNEWKGFSVVQNKPLGICYVGCMTSFGPS